MLKKIFIINFVYILFCLLIFSQNICLAEPSANEVVVSPEFEYPNDAIIAEDTESKPLKDYAAIYNALEMPDFEYLHNIDPDQFYDMKDATWAPYPLLRLNSYIYFKDRAIEPGYYLINPREHNGKWYLLFKQNGVVHHIIPVYEREITPMNFYETHLPKPKLTPSQKVHMSLLDFLGKFKSTKRKEQVKSYMEINDLDNYFVSIIIYYGTHKYHTIFRTIKL
ncbi:hypothetical protein IJO12_03185 [bacterium]|nr:hypothetical protein [bacterium]